MEDNTKNSKSPPEIPDILGIKFGSRSTVIATVKDHVIDTINISNRIIKSMVSFTKNLRTFDESAQISYLKNIPSTFVNLNRYIGLKYESKEFIEHEKKHMLFDYEYNKDINDYLYETQYIKKLPIENIISSFFTYLSKTWSNSENKKNVSGIVLSIPDTFSLYQRKIMLNILKISNINCFSLLNESSSVCLSYFMHHYRDLSPTKEKIICFLDLGQSKLSLHLCSFTNKECRVLYSKSNKFIGCRDFDLNVFNFLEQNFTEQMEKIKKNKKFYLKLLQTIEKSRKMITVNKETVINYDVGDDCMINFLLTREKFNEIIKEELVLFKNFLLNFFTESKVDIKKVEAFEMVGDMIRNPIFQEILTEIIQKNINKTMVADECIAQGCAFYAALLNEHFSPISNFNLVQFMQYDIKFKIQGKLINSEQNLISKGETYPIRKAFKFKNNLILTEEELLISFSILSESSNSFDKINEYKINIKYLIKNESNKDLILELLIDQNCLPNFDNCYFLDKDGYLSGKVEIKKISDIQISSFDFEELLKNEIDLQFIDFNTKNILNRKNEIESIVYKLRDDNCLENPEQINEYLDNILQLDSIEELNNKYYELINKYKLNDTYKDIHTKYKNIYDNIKNLNIQYENKSINIKDFNTKGRIICKDIDKLK